MLILSKEDVKKAVTMREAIDAVELAYSHYYQKKAETPLRTRIHCDQVNGDMLFMPAFMAQQGGVGIKVVSVFPENLKQAKPTISAVMLYSDSETGEHLCLMDATFMTALRTGAASGVATRYLAKESSRKAALFGTGGQALRQLEAVLEERNIEEVFIFDINVQRATDFIKLCEEELAGFSFSAVLANSPAQAVQDADIVMTATTSKTPVFSGNDIKPGTHINGIGSFTPEMQEIDEITLARAEKIVIDSFDASFKEAGDLIIPMEKGVLSKADIYSEIGKITSGEMPGRESNEEITYFKSVGIAVQDIAVAKIIYENAKVKRLGQEIEIF
ncbi:hypothetical protein MFMK1_001197 [Metallumcola ferriviriculae]|uniref:Delta(1)-pyrroline-2-carboxylate reductase n=1 Tax=Metallumcola ferriviriculae TaxID=3039180 RepID=A0AAU0UMK9_9FIRM|nr:hypothetical protein MFMK1_001197 [Desulfitibacteraceae bacterium MK1]